MWTSGDAEREFYWFLCRELPDPMVLHEAMDHLIATRKETWEKGRSFCAPQIKNVAADYRSVETANQQGFAALPERFETLGQDYVLRSWTAELPRKETCPACWRKDCTDWELSKKSVQLDRCVSCSSPISDGWCDCSVASHDNDMWQDFDFCDVCGGGPPCNNYYCANIG